MTHKILLIAGDSNAAGSEIDGSPDSVFNRHHSFGNVLAGKLNRQAVNIATCAATNSTISRSVLEWFQTVYNQQFHNVMVLIAWTESSRMEIPFHNPTWYNEMNPAVDWFPAESVKYLRVNSSWQGADHEKDKIKECQKFMASNTPYLEIYSANLVLQMQYFLNSMNINYVMCNTMHMFSNIEHLSFYKSLFDSNKYFEFDCDGFYQKYEKLGYKNKKALYWHHDQIPHQMFANELYNFIEKRTT